MLAAAEILKLTGGREIAEVVFDERTIAKRVAELGEEITAFYDTGALLVLGLLKGSFVFVPDLVRKIARPLHVDFLVAASYGSETRSSGHLRLLYDPETALEGKHLLIVEDIVDSGNTLNRLARLLKQRDPLSLEVCTLLHKHLAKDLEITPRFVGFDAPPDFLVGYGLDHAEDFRHLPFIASIKE
jgi:hypoxanthine phosphoribosyltransferase